MSQNIMVRRLVGFFHLLRDNGFGIGMAEAIDCLTALTYIDVLNRDTFRQALTCTLVKRASQLPLFNYLFESYFLGSKAHRTPLLGQGERSAVGLEGGVAHRRAAISTQNWFKAYSPQASEEERRIDPVSPANRVAVKRNIRALERLLPSLGGRRRIGSPSGAVDLKATVRISMRRGGYVYALRYYRRKPAKNRLVVLGDVSGSMDTVADQVFEALYFAANTTHNSAVFCFSTCLVRVDNILRGRSLADAKDILGSLVGVWGSGTRIGECFEELVAQHGRTLDQRTVVVVISDCWDLGDPLRLRDAAQNLRARVGGLVWLNPLADTEGYQPISSSVSAVMPYIDRFGGLSQLYSTRGLRTRLGGRWSLGRGLNPRPPPYHGGALPG